jgi:hypothetical protein
MGRLRAVRGALEGDPVVAGVCTRFFRRIFDVQGACRGWPGVRGAGVMGSLRHDSATSCRGLIGIRQSCRLCLNVAVPAVGISKLSSGNCATRFAASAVRSSDFGPRMRFCVRRPSPWSTALSRGSGLRSSNDCAAGSASNGCAGY